MRALASALALIALASGAWAEIGADAVVPGDVEACREARDGGEADWLACLASNGLPEAALAFATTATTDPGFDVEALLIAFEERGAVDTGVVVMPFLANSNEQPVFLNGDWPIASPGRFLERAPPQDSASRAILEAYPEAFAAGFVEIVAHRTLPNGRQRFVVTDVLSDGCRACEQVGRLISFVEFDGGAFDGTEVLGWTSVVEETGEDLVAAALSGDGWALQRMLNLAGYRAGPMDGAPGPMTRAALAAFQTDYCLRQSETPDEAQLTLLARANRGETQPDCTPSATARGVLPIEDGLYSRLPALCLPAGDPARPPLTDELYTAVIAVSGAELAFGENACRVSGVDLAQGRYYLRLDCQSEGEAVQHEMSLRPIGAEMFEKDDEVYLRCPGG